MSLDRRDFIRGAGAASFLAASGCVSVALPAGGDAGVRSSRTAEPIDFIKAPIKAPPGFDSRFRDLLAWLEESGWTGMLRQVAGVDVRPDNPDLEHELVRNLGRTAFGGFGGVRAIQPGDPALSLLYHVLASPGLLLDRGGGPAPQSAYASLEQLDFLENYIHSRAPLPAGEAEDFVLAMFAYEYRPARKTPHRQHSDLVYSRTGVSRVGNDEAFYDPVLRSYVNVRPGAAANRVAVTPARYGLFLARRVNGTGSVPTRIGWESRDRGRHFLVPERKVFSGCPHLKGALRFAEVHRDEKLARLIAAGMELPQELGFDCYKPPFVRHSRSITGAGAGRLHGHDSDLVRLEQKGSSVVLFPAHGELVEPAEQLGLRVRFRVPPLREPLGKRALSNRRYTSLKVLEGPFREAWDFGISDLFARGGRWTTGFRSPRNAPVFVNIRYRMGDEAGAEPSHLGPDTPALQEVTDGGGYWAGLFLDGLCDGCVVAQLEPPAGAASPDAAFGPFRTLRVLPAFSLVAAPDFFPQVDPLDLKDLDHMFFEGGVESASGGRQRANPNVPHPDLTRPAFPRPGSASATALEQDVADTITAVVSHKDSGRPSGCCLETQGLNTLPDTSSNVFAPGWDLTYSSDPGDDQVFFATFGLGSPFAEDMKLCAAANGMWPGASPDAARTFYPSLEPILSYRGSRRPPTAVPLLDDELGYHDQSPARLEHDAPEGHGWDGEHGPFFEIAGGEGGESQLVVNFADVARVDYVENARSGKLDFSRLRMLSSEELIARMRALRLCIRALPGSFPSHLTSLWLVSAEAVPDWSRGARGLGIPKGLFGDVRWATVMPGTAAPGWLYLFAKAGGNSERRSDGRAVIPCETMYVCQLAADRLRWARIVHPAVRPPGEQEWKWARA